MALDWPYYLGIAWKMVTTLVLLVIYTRMAGSRRLAPVTVFDKISNLVVGAIAGTTLLNRSIKPLDLTVFMSIWLLLLVAIRFLRLRFQSFRTLVDGTPIQLIEAGQMRPAAFRQAGLSPTSLQTMLRSQGIAGPHVVESALFERNGELSVREAKDDRFSIILIDRGQIKDEALRRSGHDHAWLNDQLVAMSAPPVAQIFCGEWDGQRLWLAAYPDSAD